MFDSTFDSMSHGERVCCSLLGLAGVKHEEYLAEMYRTMVDRCLGTQEAASWAFGSNQCTEPIHREGVWRFDEVLKAPVREQNMRAVELLDKWFAEPDDVGRKLWMEFDAEMEAHPFALG